MPYAQWHYPLKPVDKIDNGLSFPADFIAEGVDQTGDGLYPPRHCHNGLWQCSLQNGIPMASVLDKTAWKCRNAFGNVVDPFDTICTHGADATRCDDRQCTPWDKPKFDIAGKKK